MSIETVDVLIVGGGPTGTALAIDLRRRGHRIRQVEKSPRAFEGSRAKGIQPRTLEVFEDLGVLDDILSAGDNYPKMGVHLGPAVVPFAMIKTKQPRPGVPHPSTWLISQHRTNAILQARAMALGLSPESNSELISFTQSADRVVATVRRENGTEEDIVARYLVGADGAASLVRKSIGVSFEGTTDDADRVILCDATTRNLARNRWHIWPGIGGTFVGACPLPNSENFQWMVRVARDEQVDMSDDAVIERVNRRVGNKIQLTQVVWKSLFRPNIRLASKYRLGRVFLAGDAAHVHPPTGAQGLNTGVQDAYNLGWKLSRVLCGASEELLDTYEAERRPIAASVLGLATKKYEGLGTLDRSSMKRGDDEQQLGLHYRGGPLSGVCSSTQAPVLVGDRAPDAKLQMVDGQQVRLFDLIFGGHFTIVGFGERIDADVADIVWPDEGSQPRRLVILPSDTIRPMDTSVRTVVDHAGEFARVYGIKGPTVLLVRPDGYVMVIAAEERTRAVESALESVASISRRGTGS